jgi:hypothetical protein
MSELAMSETKPRAPWNLWVVGVLSLLWNAAGAYTIIAAQLGALPGMRQSEVDYYAAQAQWFVIATDVALLGGIAGAAALLIRSRGASWLYALSLVAIVITNGYDLAMGTSQMFNNSGTVITTCLIWVLALLQLWYAAAMRRRGLLT